MEKGRDEDHVGGGRDHVVLEISELAEWWRIKESTRENFKTCDIFIKVCREY